MSLVSPKELPELLLLRAKIYMALDDKIKAQELSSKALSLAKEGNLSIDKFEDFCKSVR
ncbi:hypothetical protein [Siphonobacter sp. SORGH_AS_0500]|uniref:hypothetical protein n=1 Tax=Siphonobacter sp. SORGH_AS_0500 TaxID=1864824 RepID=UPI0012FF16B6|nr:hypothetical protein [Siphonobacter sp. SORGH_AS_0500]